MCTTQKYYSCCGKNVCGGCVYSFYESGNGGKCPFCNSDRASKTEEEKIEEIMNRMEANDAASICMLANHYINGFAAESCKRQKNFTLGQLILVLARRMVN